MSIKQISSMKKPIKVNISMDYYERIELIELSEEPKAKITIEEICEELLIEAGKQRNWTGALRSLLVIHKMIHKLGSKGRHPISFANAKEINHFSTLKATDNSPETLLHVPHVGYYLKYLQRLSYSYNDFHICFFPNKTLPESFVNDNLSFMNFLHRLQNILGYLIKHIPLLEVSFIKFPHLNNIKQLAYFYLTDCFYFYSYLTQAIIAMLKITSNLTYDDLLSLYEIYSTHVEMTTKVKEIFELSRYLEEFEIRIPSYFEASSNFHSKFSDYVSDLKASSIDPNDLSQEDSSKIQRKSISTDEESEESINITKSLQEITKITSSFIHPNQQYDPQSGACLFKPPNMAKKRPQGPLTIPRIRILRPNNHLPSLKVAEKLYQRTIDPNINLLRVPGLGFQVPRGPAYQVEPTSENVRTMTMGDETFYPSASSETRSQELVLGENQVENKMISICVP